MLRSSWLAAMLASCGFFHGDDDTPPTVVAVSPADGAAAVWLHDPITVTFSEAIDPTSVSPATVVVSAEDGTPIAATAALDRSGTTMTVQIADDAAVIGGVRLTLAEGLTDVAGNALAAASVGWTAPAWSRAEQNGATPSLAISDGNRVLVASNVGAGSARRVVVSELGASGWLALGDELGAADSALPSITFDAQDRPIVVWSEFGATVAVRAARWDGAAWIPVASPGDGAYAVAARVAGGDPLVAFVTSASGQNQNAVRVMRFADDAWQPLGNDVRDIAVNGSVTGIPQLALATPDTPVVAFVDTGSSVGTNQPSVRVLRWTGTCQETAIPLGVPQANGNETTGAFNRVAIAARGDTIDVAYDTYSGFSFGVHVARIGANGWQPLGGELDVDSPADAQAPAIAYDTDGTPFVAWRELVEGNWRGFVARWDGTAWRAVGGGAWNDDPTRELVRPALAFGHGRAPVIAWGEQSLDPAGAITTRVARWNGPAVPRFGIEARASISGCAFDGTQATLSATGCFTISNGRATPHAGLIPFDIVSELWSDGARKRRWIALPDGQMMSTPASGAWTAPPGSMLIKEFAIETTPGDPRTRRVMETRFLLVGTSSTTTAALQGFSFRWRADGSDADLLPDAESTAQWPLDNGTMHTHSYPSRAQCLRCHHASNGPLLGVRSGQLARRFDYDGVMGDQLDTLAHIGAIAQPSEVQPFASPHDVTLPLETRMRGYLAANCSHCHNPTGERPTRDFRWETPLAQTKLCGTDAEVVAGDPASSVIFQRISTRVNGMPPLATLMTDPVAIDIIGRWIATETNCQ